jgi:hypothetical protein
MDYNVIGLEGLKDLGFRMPFIWKKRNELAFKIEFSKAFSI